MVRAKPGVRPAAYANCKMITVRIALFWLCLRFLIYLNFVQRETTAGTSLGVVTDRWASNNWAQRTGRWTWEESLSLLDTLLTPPLLASRLVEPGANMPLPVFVEMGIRDHIVAFTHFELGLF